MVATFEQKKNFSVVGTRPIRHDGLDKVTGRAVYGGDVKLPGLIWGDVLQDGPSPRSHPQHRHLRGGVIARRVRGSDP